MISSLYSQAAFTDSWVARGFCIAFVGLLDVLFDHEDDEGNVDNGFEVYTHAVGMLVISVGVTYTGLGLLCFRQLKTAAMAKLKRQKSMKDEVHHLTAQKIEIERLLADTESKLQSL